MFSGGKCLFCPETTVMTVWHLTFLCDSPRTAQRLLKLDCCDNSNNNTDYISCYWDSVADSRDGCGRRFSFLSLLLANPTMSWTWCVAIDRRSLTKMRALLCESSWSTEEVKRVHSEGSEVFLIGAILLCAVRSWPLKWNAIKASFCNKSLGVKLQQSLQRAM